MFPNKSAVAEIFKGFSTLFNQTFMDTQVYWKQVAAEVNSVGASEDYKWLEGVPMPREWKGPRQVVGLSGKHYEVYNQSFESTIGIPVEDIEDDKLNVHAPRVQELGQYAAYHVDALVFAALAAAFTALGPDGVAFISNAHPGPSGNQSNTGGGASDPWFILDTAKVIKPIIYQNRKNVELTNKTQVNDDNVFLDNQALFGTYCRRAVAYGRWQYLYGSKATLDATNFATGMDTFGSFVDQAGVPIPSEPKLLVVHPSLKADARAILDVEFLTGGASNPWYKAIPWISVPWLSYTARP